MKKKILIIDDSALMRRLVCDIINADGRFQADDYCKDGKAGYETLLKTQYDAVILDVNMPIMSGLELLQKLKDENIHVNIIVVSSTMNPGSEEVIKATQLGVFDYILKPSNFVEARGEVFRNKILDSLAKATNADNAISSIAQVPDSKVEKKKEEFKEHRADETIANRRIGEFYRPRERVIGNKLIALACSTGGPKALHSIIPYLSKNIDAPIVLVQHMPVGFTNLLAERLNKVSRVEVKEAEDGETIKNGHVYIAPGGFHLRVIPGSGNTHKIRLSQEPPQGGLRPYANYMYESLENCNYDEITCVVLTGMGADGTKGIAHLKEKKNVYVIVQNKETCAVYGMPKSIVDAGLQDEIVPLGDVYQSITKNVGVR